MPAGYNNKSYRLTLESTSSSLSNYDVRQKERLVMQNMIDEKRRDVPVASTVLITLINAAMMIKVKETYFTESSFVSKRNHKITNIF